MGTHSPGEIYAMSQSPAALQKAKSNEIAGIRVPDASQRRDAEP